MSGPELIALAGSAASVLAAAAAWAAVRQIREGIRESRRPRLVAVHLEAEDGTVQFIFESAGAGVALIPQCALVSGRRFMFGLIGEGPMRPGERWRLETVIQSTTNSAEGVLWCENTAGEFFAWSLDDHSKRWPERPNQSPQQTFHQFYPDVTVDIDTALLPGEMRFRRVTA